MGPWIATAGIFNPPTRSNSRTDRDIFTGFEFLVRYEDYNVDLTRDPTDSRTWDRETVTLAVLTDVVKNTKIKTEFYINEESTGGPDVDNNEVLVQLEIKF